MVTKKITSLLSSKFEIDKVFLQVNISNNYCVVQQSTSPDIPTPDFAISQKAIASFKNDICTGGFYYEYYILISLV